MSQLCQWCGVHLHGRPRPVIVQVDGHALLRAVICVRCRDELRDDLNAAWIASCLSNGVPSILQQTAPSYLVTGHPERVH